ncbi:receptor-type tyrosine-protein phosphatase eta-like [Cyclopterus lumpus]|uniref:receptor-type tyrosine-protein phosphatase eta-like n=1 Tax=Cyclopterus lumpus TaxID=8103 RepID=UPI001486E5E6|nr:receptor-type tyrosine-protein phosphatase eta-like [Cyclopterus lumpus]
MGKLYLERICIFISYCFSSALLLMSSAAEQQYFFPDQSNLTWHEARTHCQFCFKELVTVTPENIKTISQNITSDCWVGLRKNISSTDDFNTSWAEGEPLNSSTSWSHWADGEPLIFQNWYPGWPVLASSPMPGEPECGSYIEDSCVAMLSFGAWVEKNCSDRLPFICYDERFIGRANVTNITSESAVLTWQVGPGDIDHYRVKVNEELNQSQTNNLTYDLVNLTSGTHYSVQVFPVKCTRDLDPQEIAFYTKPNKVENLAVTTVTETSVFLNWNPPAGNVDSYLIEVQGEKRIQNKTEGNEVCGLTPGTVYTFTVFAGVGNNIWSEESNITEYTKPGKVSGLTVSESTNNSLLLGWVRPDGHTSGFRVTAMNDSNHVMFNDTKNQTEVKVTALPMGSKVTLSVTALTANNTLEGDQVTVVAYTAPGPISNLTLVTTFDSLEATWKPPEGNSVRFTVELQLDDKPVYTTHNLTKPRKHFDGLKTAANYTVILCAFSGPLKGPSVRGSKFTRLLPPTNATVISYDKHQLTFQWSAPDNTAKVKYSVRINSSFWGHTLSDLDEETSHRFDGLISGTRYDFEVRTMADGKLSTPAVVSHFTDAEEREISLSMSCSSAESLLCDKHTTRERVFKQFRKHFTELLGDKVFWKLEKQEIEGK